MDVTEQIAQQIAEFKKGGGKPTHLFIAPDVYPFGHPEWIDGVKVFVDYYIPSQTLYICDFTGARPNPLTWSSNGN